MTKLDDLADSVNYVAAKVDSLEKKLRQLTDKKAPGEDGAFEVCQPILFNVPK